MVDSCIMYTRKRVLFCIDMPANQIYESNAMCNSSEDILKSTPYCWSKSSMMQFMQNGTINLVEYMAENNRNLAKDNKDLGKTQ